MPVDVDDRPTVSTKVARKDSGETCLAVRWQVAICSFFALFFSYSFRLNFTVGLSCMVQPDVNSFLPRFSSNLSDDHSSATRNSRHVNYSGNSSLGGVEQTEGFPWSKQTQANLLSAFFFGFLLFQIPGGWLARRYGTRRVLGYAMILSILATLLTPICARTHIYLLFALRVLVGISQGVSLPAVYNLVGRWVPPLETSRYMALCTSGFPIGYVVSFGVSRLLCTFGFDQGWGSIFYVFDIAGVLWIIVWFYIVYDTPLVHPRISEKERQHIVQRVGRYESKEERKQMTPWCKIFTSRPVWGTGVAFFTTDWVHHTLQLGFILYMREVLQYKISSSGLLAVLPFLAQFFTALLAGYAADVLIKRKIFSKANTRRVMQGISSSCMGAFVAATGFISKEHSFLAIIFLLLARAFHGISRAGFIVSVMDFAPRFAGEISGILNTVSAIPVFIVPVLIRRLTPNDTQEEWRNIFLIGGAVSVLGAVIFSALVEGETQPWAEFKTPVAESEAMLNDSQPSREIKKTGAEKD